jgi:hypothetical protein
VPWRRSCARPSLATGSCACGCRSSAPWARIYRGPLALKKWQDDRLLNTETVS